MSRKTSAVLLLLTFSSNCIATSQHNSSSSPSPHSSSTQPSSAPVSSIPSSQSTTSFSLSPSLTTTPETTCRFRTANYITHGLPQQCLRKSWATQAPDASQASDAAASEATTTPSTISHPVEAYTFSLISPEISPSATESALPPTSPSPSGSNDSTAVESAASDDTESPLDNTKFLSFEEWKAQNLAKAGQSAENFGQRAVREPRKRPGSVNGDIDSLGEDAEIEVDLFASEGGNGGDETVSANIARGEKPSEPVSPHGHTRSKDAGKTCKERFNYASFDCAATVHKTNPEGKGATSILVENKDSYMLNKCNAKNKFVIIELCDDILVDTVVLANYEFFSSMFRTFRVSVSDRYPVKAAGWKELGLYEAKNSREIQAFLVDNPLIWARYLRIEFLTHYGNEFYCPLSLLRVHGTTMMEEFRHQEELARGELDDREEVEPEAVAPEVAGSVVEEQKSSSVAEMASPTKSWVNINPSGGSGSGVSDPSGSSGTPAPSVSICNVLEPPLPFDSVYAGGIVCPAIHTPVQSTSSAGTYQTKSPTAVGKGTKSKSTQHQAPVTTVPPKTASGASAASYKASSSASSPSSGSSAPSEAGKHDPSSRANAGSAVHGKSSQHGRSGGSQTVVSRGTPARPSNVTEQHHHHQKSHSSSATSAPPASPTTQESFYKTIHKRLQLLEANATLSLQYIEEQSRLFRDAFGKMEKRQLSKTSAFIESLNMTVFKELIGFRQQYDQLWQSTVIALESQKELSDREIVAISQRLSILADEVIYQKRMSIIQSILLLVTIVLIIFSKTNHFDTPIMQTMLSSRSSYPRLPLESPPTSPAPPLIRKYMHAHHHSRETSDGYNQERNNVDVQYHHYQPQHPGYSPPSSPEYLAVHNSNGGVHATQSSPATPSGRNSRKVSWSAEFGSPLNSEGNELGGEGDDVEEEQHHHQGQQQQQQQQKDEEEDMDEGKVDHSSGLMTPMSEGVSSLRRTASDITPTIVYPDPADDDSDDGADDVYEEFLDA